MLFNGTEDVIAFRNTCKGDGARVSSRNAAYRLDGPVRRGYRAPGALHGHRTGGTFMRKLLFAASLLLCSYETSIAQNWPSKPLRAIVPFSAGGAVDVIARTVFDKVSNQIGQSIIIENRVGAGGTTGAAAVAKADPDGYTLLVHSSSHTVAPALFAKLSYDAAADFGAVIPLANLPTVLFVSSAQGYRDIAHFVETAKTKSGSMNYGSGGVGNATHLNAERFMLSAGFQATHVPFKGSPEALTEVLA